MKTFFMREAIKEAEKALEIGEVPVGAIIVRNGEIIARAHNLRETGRNPIYHAEMLAIDQAAKKLGGWRLIGCEIYVTLEPCSMCTGAIIQSRIERLYIGTNDLKTGSCGGKINLLEPGLFNHTVEVEFGILKEDCANLIKSFFKKLRNK